MLSAIWRARFVRAWRDGLPKPWSAMLAPVALAYRGGLALHRAAYGCGLLRTGTLPCGVVGVGNLTVGGTGKTPLVELIARTLASGGRRVIILSRGYGRGGSERIGLASDGGDPLLTAAEAGDEPVLLARRLRGIPVVVGRDRLRAGAWAVARFSPDVVILDDGFQNRRLRKDVEVVCLDARAPWGHGGLLPRGCLREPPAALARAHLLVLTQAASGVDLPRVEAEVRAWAPTAPLALAAYEAEAMEELDSGALRPFGALRSRPTLAFAGIAVPEGFVRTLAEQGVRPRDFVAFPDHHPYDPADVRMLERRARGVGAEVLLTTEKDAVRIGRAGRDVGSMPVWVLRIRLRFIGGFAAWWTALEARLASR